MQDGGLPFARCLKDVHSEFRLLCKLSELLLKEGQQQEALQYATIAVEISTSTGNKAHSSLNFIISCFGRICYVGILPEYTVVQMSGSGFCFSIKRDQDQVVGKRIIF